MDGTSSPDPLADSLTYSAANTRRSSRVTKSFPIRGSSPKKQTFQLDLGNDLSPQKIKVTVEAGSDEENNYILDYGRSSSPSRVRRREHTTTTTVPVKGLSDTEEGDNTQYSATPKRGRGRPRKSGTPVPNKKRASTPVRKSAGKRRSIGELVDGDDDKDVDYRLSQDVEIGRGKEKSRSRSTKGVSRKYTGADQADVQDNELPKKKGRPRKRAPEQVPVPEDVNRASGGCAESMEASNIASPSAFSTIRSTATTEGEQEPDVVLARFDPGNETPRRTGWTSPTIIQAGRSSSSRTRADSYPSPCASPETRAVSGERDYTTDFDCGDTQYAEEEEEEEEEQEDEVGEMREFDTILESEGFSMISVDSVPSLREHFSSPAPELEKESAKPVRHRNIVSLQNEKSFNDSFSSIPEDVLDAASPVRKPQNANLLSVQNAHVNDSFSSIPPDVLEAATPARPQQKNHLLEATKSNQEYEDSFSAIPPTILDAATPAAVRKDNPASERLSVPGLRSSSFSRKVASPRLLTPEETPSPPQEHVVEDSGANRKFQPSSSKAVAKKILVENSQLPSSPPVAAPRRYTYTAHIRNHRQINPDITQTPSIVFSSPSLPPLLQPVREQPGLHPVLDLSQRPTLSPIARAGRVLQDIVVPSSPRSRSQSLGSPFKSPAADRRSSSIVPQEPAPMQDRLAGPLPRLDLTSHFSDKSSQRLRSESSTQEDPFQNNGTIKERSPSPEQNQPYTLELPHQRHTSDPRFMNIRSEANSLGSDDAMSWQADEPSTLYEHPKSIRGKANPSTARRYPLERECDQTKKFAVTSEQRWAAERSEVSKQISSANPDKVITIDSDDEEPIHGQDEEEDFGLLLETLNSSSPAVEQRQQPVKETIEKPRRSKLPSPWRQNSKRLVYSDEISHLSSPSSPKLGARFDVTKVGTDTTSQPVTVRHVGVQEMSDSVDPDLSGWQIPQKSNFKPRPRETGHLDLSALLSASPAKQLPVLATSSQSSLLQREGCSRSLSAEVDSTEAQPTTTGFTPIPQKMGFAPRPRTESTASAANKSNFLSNASAVPSRPSQPISYPPLGSSPPRVATPFGSSSPSRTNTLSAHHKFSAELSPSVDSPDYPRSSQVSPNEKENLAIDTRTVEWTKSLGLPTAHPSTTIFQPPSSPVKSCLRSPLKTPSAQTGPGFPDISPTKAVQFVSSSPVPSSPPQGPLSSTKWSKDHWQLLDEILESWRPDSAYPNKEQRQRRNSTRVISRLLGKTVRSMGESMVFEQWHLEAVDEFRGCVPGWEEKVIAMRLFSLILGAERRARGVSTERRY